MLTEVSTCFTFCSYLATFPTTTAFKFSLSSRHGLFERGEEDSVLTKVYQFTTTVFVVGNVLNRDDNYDDDTTWPYLLFPVSALPFMSMNAVEMHSRPLYLYFSIHSVDVWKHLSTHEIPPVYFSKSSALDPKF